MGPLIKEGYLYNIQHDNSHYAGIALVTKVDFDDRNYPIHLIYYNNFKSGQSDKWVWSPESFTEIGPIEDYPEYII